MLRKLPKPTRGKVSVVYYDNGEVVVLESWSGLSIAITQYKVANTHERRNGRPEKYFVIEYRPEGYWRLVTSPRCQICEIGNMYEPRVGGAYCEDCGWPRDNR